jgi:hypothetical protein
MKKISLSILVLLNLAPSFAETLEQRISRLEEKLEENELDKSLERFKFSGTFINYSEYLNSNLNYAENNSDRNPDEEVDSQSYGLLTGMHLGLNIDATITDRLSFLTTLAFGKVWNNDGRTGITEEPYRSNQGSYGYTGSDAKFDVAYVRWRSESKNWTFALGRMSTQGGPPMNQLDALYRNGTYPRFSYNVILDGVAAVYDFKKFLPENLGFKTRLFYTPYFFLDQEDRNSPDADEDGFESNRKADQIAWLNEFEINQSSFAEKISLFSMFWYYDNFFDKEYQDTERAGVEYYRAVSHTLYLGLERLFGTGLNLSWSYLTVDSQLSGDDEYKSNSSLINLNYVFRDKYVLGYENITTDKNFYLDEFTYLNFNDFYQRSNTNGHHVFFAVKFPHQQTVRVGHFNYTAGEAPNNDYYSKETTNNTYVSYRLDF